MPPQLCKSYLTYFFVQSSVSMTARLISRSVDLLGEWRLRATVLCIACRLQQEKYIAGCNRTVHIDMNDFGAQEWAVNPNRECQLIILKSANSDEAGSNVSIYRMLNRMCPCSLVSVVTAADIKQAFVIFLLLSQFRPFVSRTAQCWGGNSGCKTKQQRDNHWSFS